MANPFAGFGTGFAETLIPLLAQQQQRSAAFGQRQIQREQLGLQREELEQKRKADKHRQASEAFRFSIEQSANNLKMMGEGIKQAKTREEALRIIDNPSFQSLSGQFDRIAQIGQQSGFVPPINPAIGFRTIALAKPTQAQLIEQKKLERDPIKVNTSQSPDGNMIMSVVDTSTNKVKQISLGKRTTPQRIGELRADLAFRASNKNVKNKEVQALTPGEADKILGRLNNEGFIEQLLKLSLGKEFRGKPSESLASPAPGATDFQGALNLGLNMLSGKLEGEELANATVEFNKLLAKMKPEEKARLRKMLEASK